MIDAIINNSGESRKEWLLNIFEQYGRENRSNSRYQFRQHENHLVLLEKDMYSQRMDYLHENPVCAGFVSRPEHWLYSSAIDYYVINGKGMLDLDAVSDSSVI